MQTSFLNICKHHVYPNIIQQIGWICSYHGWNASLIDQNQAKGNECLTSLLVKYRNSCLKFLLLTVTFQSLKHLSQGCLISTCVLSKQCSVYPIISHFSAAFDPRTVPMWLLSLLVAGASQVMVDHHPQKHCPSNFIGCSGWIHVNSHPKSHHFSVFMVIYIDLPSILPKISAAAPASGTRPRAMNRSGPPPRA